ncbi:hypothetical protein EGR_09596 [Echinococcus granulosus]|uniref:Uncharacterized protein n=1 Tax=Echinococcus granulosus TaxID=6210 RepID=W6UQA1_ECHGR|nr:hypothetical protein EGR_09596 [Echinococcus granulosus]EUB55559.1 hypothetical protein EGR_09596 [Echinococcus granulosus]
MPSVPTKIHTHFVLVSKKELKNHHPGPKTRETCLYLSHGYALKYHHYWHHWSFKKVYYLNEKLFCKKTCDPAQRGYFMLAIHSAFIFTAFKTKAAKSKFCHRSRPDTKIYIKGALFRLHAWGLGQITGEAEHFKEKLNHGTTTQGAPAYYLANRNAASFETANAPLFVGKLVAKAG